MTFKKRMNGEKAFEEGLGKDPDLDEVPRVTKHGKKDHEKVTLYKDGIPENIGKKKVEEMFKGKEIVNLANLSSKLFRVTSRKN